VENKRKEEDRKLGWEKERNKRIGKIIEGEPTEQEVNEEE
jgi:hypothetical protein